jgi:predicted GIY-YIG superfamily endonuclease
LGDILQKNMFYHNQGKTKSIKHLIPFELIYYEAYAIKRLARKREIELKNSSFKKKELFERLEQ